jgi:Phospholipase_D-nuclease N-terminal
MLAFFNLGGGEIILILAMFLLLPLTLLGFAFWIWMLIDSIKNERIQGGEKVAWVLVIALTHFLGAVIYFFAGRSRKA